MIAVFVDSTGVITWPQQPDMQAKVSNTDADLSLSMISNVPFSGRGYEIRCKGLVRPFLHLASAPRIPDRHELAVESKVKT